MPKPGYSGMGKPEHKGGKMGHMNYAKQIKSGGGHGGGKSIPVDHGPRATNASPAGSGKTGFAKWKGTGNKMKSAFGPKKYNR